MRSTILIVTLSIFIGASTAMADDLTLMVEKDLAALGYETGAVDGEETMETVIAISKFQAQNDVLVTGEVTPQLAGMLSAKVSGSAPTPSSGAPAEVPAPEADTTALQAAQQACLEEKIQKQQAKNEKKRGLSNLLGAAGRIAARQGNYDIQQATAEAYDANATADDLGIIAKELGLSKKQIKACENPG